MSAPGTPVRQVREAAEISLRQLEDLTGINRAAWSQIENGRLLPQAQHITALSLALGVPSEEWEIRFVLERKAEAS